MNETEWEQFWFWFKTNFQDEDGAWYHEVFEDLRQLYEGNVSLSDIGVSKYYLQKGFTVCGERGEKDETE